MLKGYLWSFNFLLLNADKTEVIVLGPESLKKKLISQSLCLDEIKLFSDNKVKNLGVIFDQDLSFRFLEFPSFI